MGSASVGNRTSSPRALPHLSYQVGSGAHSSHLTQSVRSSTRRGFFGVRRGERRNDRLPRLSRWSIGKDGCPANVGSVEIEPVVTFLQRLKEESDLLRGAGRIEPDQADGCPRAEDRNHDRLVIDRIHENVAAVTLVIESVEFYFADPARQLARGRKGPRGQGRDDGHVHYRHVAILRNDVA